MGIVGDHPEGGVRWNLARLTAEAPWVYEGSAFTADAEHRLRATLHGDGEVTVEPVDGLPRGLAQRLERILRAALRQARSADADAAPPRRLRRWRAEW